MSDGQQQLRTEIRVLVDKQCYFFLSAAGASIGFATTQIVGVKEIWEAVSINTAMVLWAVSFFFGYRFLVNDEETLNINLAVLKASSDVRAEGHQVSNNDIEKIVIENSKPYRSKIPTYRTLQVWIFFIGAIIFAFGQSIPLLINYDDRPANISEMSNAEVVTEKVSP